MAKQGSVEHLLAWYTRRARPFFAENLADQRELETLDKQGQRLHTTLQRAKEDVTVCFLGHAGVGKSTLINAVVSDNYTILPQGGVGPLTALATIVRHAEEPYFRAEYFDATSLRKVYLILEKAQELATRGASGGAAILAQEADEQLRREVEEAAEVEGPGGDVMVGGTSKLEANQRQARLMIQGSQFGELDLPYLIDGMRTALGLQPRLGKTLEPDDARRVDAIRRALTQALAGGEFHRERRADGDLPGFLLELRDHASRHLAPLIKRLEVGWNAESLANGLVLADLPGIGIALDQYREVTTEFVRNRARVVVVVVDRAGVTVDTVRVLRDTGFFANLLHSSYDPMADPVTLAVAVVKLDLTADDEWRHDRALNGPSARKWGEHFRETCAKATEFVRAATKQELQKLVEESGAENRAERQAAMDNILAMMQVHPVSASELRKLALDDEEDKPRIKAAEESNVPHFRAALIRLASLQRGRAEERAHVAFEDFREHVRAKLSLLHAQWEGESRAEREARELGAELDEFLAPMRRELDVRKGAFREFLRTGIPAQIEGRVSEATIVAQREIDRFLGRYQTMHWARLRAAVRRGGRWESNGQRHVDLPGELTLRFEEPIAVVWSKHVIQELRGRTKELGDDYVTLMSTVVEWAQGRSARVQPRFVEALRDDTKAQTKELTSVGKQAVDDLKTAVQQELAKKLEARIRQSCETFVLAKRDQGPGVKQAILEHFRGELSEAVVDAARPAALRVLLKAYEEVSREIEGAFGAIRDPLESARDALVESHEDSIRRSDATKRKRVLTQVEAVLREFPSAEGADL